MNISYQLELRQELLTVYGPLDYREFRDQLIHIDEILTKSKLEDTFLLPKLDPSKNIEKQIGYHRMAFRTMLLLNLTNESYRNLAFRLADSKVCRWFIGVNTISGRLKPPSKSSIQRFERVWPKKEISRLIHDLNKSTMDVKSAELLLQSNSPLNSKEVYADSTCIKSNIHYPVDWLLLRDAVITLIKSINLIRGQKLLHRISDPNSFMKRVNQLSISMTQASRNRSGKKERKKIFRKMKALIRTVEKHAIRYHGLLENMWEETDWSEKEARHILTRMSNVIEQIPSIIEIAHKRIISEQHVANAEKILSLYEKNVHVIKRGKMNNEVEFGNSFYLAEQRDGIILDWDFIKDSPKSDTRILRESIARLKEKYPIESIATDRGFNCKSNDHFLEKEKVFNATCSRNVNDLKVKMLDETYREAQKRRAQTEARIGIFKNKFIGQKIMRKGFENREDKILWSILTHNLWVLARIAQKNLKAQTDILQKAA